MTVANPALPLADGAEPLNSKEQALWLFQDLADDAGVLNVAVAFRSSRPLRWWPLRAAAQHLVYRHPVLRTVFPEADGLPTRKVLEPHDEQAAVDVDVRRTTEASCGADLAAFTQRRFEIRAELPVRFGHFSGDPSGDVVCVVVHHIVFDAVSGSVLLRELLSLYESLANTNAIAERLAAVVPACYEPAPRPEDVQYWRDHLAGFDPAAKETAVSGLERQSFAGASLTTELPADVLTALSAELGATPNIVLLALYALLLRANGVGDDLVVGVLVDTRGAEQHTSVGYHVALLPIRLRITDARTLREFVRATRDVFLTGALHATASVDDVFPGSYERDGSWGVPLFRHLFNFHVSPLGDLGTDYPWIDLCDVETGFSRLDLELHVRLRETVAVAQARYRRDVLDTEQAGRLLAGLVTLLHSAAADPDREVGAFAGLVRVADGTVCATRRLAAVPPRLPEPRHDIHQPDDELLATLLELCRDTFRDPAMEVDTHFFRGHGVNSLLAARLVARIRAQVGVRLSLRHVFTAPTPAALAHRVSEIRIGQR